MLNMGTYSNRNHTVPEGSSTGESVSHFSWFNPGRFLSTPETSCRPPPGIRFNPEPCLRVSPVSFVSPEPQTHGSGMKHAKTRKHDTSAVSKAKKPKKSASASIKIKKQSVPKAKREKKNLGSEIGKISFDLSSIPSPFCSCTSTPRACYKWGAGGWQSSCCNFNISEYPLPISSTRPGTRIAGRKMSNGAYVKLLLKLEAEGHDLSQPVDLKDHWARHGTNKFVTIK